MSRVNEVSLTRDDTERCVVVPADRLRCRVQHERHPELQWTLHHRRGKGGIDHGERATDGTDLLEV